MRIYKSPIKKKSLLQKYIVFSFKKKIIIKLIFFLFIGGSFLIPLDLFRSKSSSLKLIAQVISRSASKIDPKYGFLSIDVMSLGDNLFGISQRYLNSFFNNPDELEINLKLKNYKKIRQLRNKAIRESKLIRSNGDKVGGFLSYKGKNFPIKLRLKGDWTDHLTGEKWSFRVETKKDSTFLGMREFSLQHPRTRNYISEYLFHRFLEYEGLPFLRYKFLPVSINGNYLGIYSLEEHFSKELIENSKFREGPILKLSDKDLRNEWNRKDIQKISSEDKTVIKGYLNTNQNNSQIQTFNVEKIAKNEKKLSQFQLGFNLLNEFLKQNKKTSEVFDISMTAKYFAISDLLQALGANTWYDMRFYFNPITSRLTPIGYDAQIEYIQENRSLSIDQNTLKIFEDPIFISNYISELNRITKKDYLENFLKSISNDLKKEISVINKSFPFVNFDPIKDEIFKNRIYILNRLFKLEPIGIQSINFQNNKEYIELEIFNKNKFPIIIQSLNFQEKTFVPDSQNLLPGKSSYRRIPMQKIKLKQKDFLTNKKNKNLKNQKYNNSYLKNIVLNYSINGIPTIRSIQTKVFQKVKSTDLKNPIVLIKPTNKDFKEIKVDNYSKEFFINKNIIIKEPLILPKGYKLIIAPGVEVTLAEKGLIIVQGALIIKGEESSKIIIKSIENGKGISVLNSPDFSDIRFASFQKLKPNTVYSNNLTGGVSFYNSPVKIYNSEFVDSSSEDSLNLIRSPFIIKNSSFVNNTSDGIDIDFSDGKIENSSFKNSGNDAIDVSGSKVILDKINIITSGDKAISVGENSKVSAFDIKIKDAFIGIASKDFSSIDINKLNIKNSNICLAAYQKKKEYGPGYIKLKNIDSFCKRNYVLEEGSTIKTIGINLLPTTKNAFKELYN